VPLIISPVTLANRAGSCSYPTPAWLQQGLNEAGSNNRRHQIALRLNTYLEQAEHPYIHLLDGGLADNLGIRAVVERIIIHEGMGNALRHFRQEDAGHVVLIVVDASAIPPSQWELSPAGPSEAAVLDAATTTPLANYSFEMLEFLRGNLTEWLSEMREARCGQARKCALPEIHLIELRLQDLPDPAQRRRLTSIPTGLTLEPGMAGELIQAGRELLRTHPQYRRLLDKIEAVTSTSPGHR
jgi:NTE family protein